MKQLRRRVATAVSLFWETLREQGERQGSVTGRRDAGNRSAATGGAQLRGFASLVTELLVAEGIPEAAIFRKKDVALPGFFRPTKEWDLLVVCKGRLLVSVELKSQFGPSFGNNFNNRTEEALGSATDLWTAYREGAFEASPRPWLGYFMLLEEEPRSLKPISVLEPHFEVFGEFKEKPPTHSATNSCARSLCERDYMTPPA
jgi:Restriction endonuclease XhoI